VITRIAPTPSGFLHAGNCVNFLLVDWLARESGGQVVLRIDDVDAVRYRPEYVADIFRLLDWLGIRWDRGPRDLVDFESSFAMRNRTAQYRVALDSMLAAGVAYVCACSRSELRAASSLTCVNSCSDKDLQLIPGRTAARLHVSEGTSVDIGGIRIDVHREMGDFVVWRRDDLPSYQLASVVEDRDLGVTHIVRGADLLPSTAAQLLLAPAVGADSLSKVVFLHHALIADESGRKLSKSRMDDGPLTADDPTLAYVTAAASGIAATSGITPAAAQR